MCRHLHRLRPGASMGRFSTPCLFSDISLGEIWRGTCVFGRLGVMSMRLRVLSFVAVFCLFAVPAFADYTVYVGYADSLRASGFFPNPWSGSPNTIFIGNTGANLDTGAIRIVNTGLVPININDILYHQSSGTNYDLWGSPGVLNPGWQLIVDQTAFYNFDSSDSNDFMPG